MGDRVHPGRRGEQRRKTVSELRVTQRQAGEHEVGDDAELASARHDDDCGAADLGASARGGGYGDQGTDAAVDQRDAAGDGGVLLKRPVVTGQQADGLGQVQRRTAAQPDDPVASGRVV